MIGRERLGYLLSDGDVVEIKPFWRFRFHQPDLQITFQGFFQRDDIRVGPHLSLICLFLMRVSTFKTALQSRTACWVKGSMGKYISEKKYHQTVRWHANMWTLMLLHESTQSINHKAPAKPGKINLMERERYCGRSRFSPN